jgi:hypothetical protein
LEIAGLVMDIESTFFLTEALVRHENNEHTIEFVSRMDIGSRCRISSAQMTINKSFHLTKRNQYYISANGILKFGNDGKSIYYGGRAK